MKIVFVNGSPNKNGNTRALAEKLIGTRDYELLDLNDYRINNYGQSLPGDQFDEVVNKIKEADVVIMGSPVYWHNICGSLRNFLDRCYGPIRSGEFKGRKLAFVFQGASPEKWMLEAGEYTMSRFAGLYGFEYLGMACNAAQAQEVGKKL